MLFPTHLVAALIVARVSTLSPLWLVVGAAVPDLLDKPLATLGVVDLFHSVGHSALLLPVAVLVATRGRAGVGASVGWVSHLLLDALHVVVNGRPADALFLAWPLAVPPDPLALPPIPFLFHYLWSPAFVIEIGLWLALCAVLAGSTRSKRDTLVDDR